MPDRATEPSATSLRSPPSGRPPRGPSSQQTYLESQHAFDDANAWGHRVYTKSGMVGSLPDDLVDAFVDHVARSPPGDDIFSIWAFGGAVGRVPEDATAFQGRSAPFWVGTETMWDDPADDQAHRDWARAGIGLVEPYRVSGGYVNDVSEARRRRHGPKRLRRRASTNASSRSSEPGIPTTSSG